MSSSTSNTNLQVEISSRQILRIALPITLAMLVPQINFLTNNIFLGNLGGPELATAGLTGVFYLIFSLVGNGLNTGLQGLLARRAGENRPEDIGKLFTQGIWVSLSFAAIAILLTYSLAAPFLNYSLHSSIIKQQATGFLRVRILGIPFLYLFQMCNALLVSTSNSRYMKYGFWSQAALNIFLDYSLIYGHFGLPRLGFNGAAYASIIAEFTGMMVVLGIIFYKKFHHRFSLFTHWRFHKDLSGLIFRQSSPLVMQWLISIFAWILFYVFIEHHGERSLAISNVMRNVLGVFGIFVWAFASTTNAMVSNIIGQGKQDQVIQLVNKIVKLSLSFTLTLCLIVNLFPGFFLEIFGRDRTFIEDAVPVIRMVSVGVLCMSVATVWLNTVTGTGNTKVNLLIEIICISIYCFYIYFIIEDWKLSLVWAWASEIVYWSSLFTLSFLYIKSGRWKGKVI